MKKAIFWGLIGLLTVVLTAVFALWLIISMSIDEGIKEATKRKDHFHQLAEKIRLDERECKDSKILSEKECKAAALEKLQSEGKNMGLSADNQYFEALYSPAAQTCGARVKGAPHRNGGGFVANTASVAKTAFVGKTAAVCQKAKVSGQARISSWAKVRGHARVFGNARVSGWAKVRGHARVFGHARISGWAKVRGHAQVSGQARVSGWAKVRGHARVFGIAKVTGGQVSGNAQVSGQAHVSGFSVVKGTTKVCSGTHTRGPAANQPNCP